MLSYIEKASSVEKVGVSSENYLHDLNECVCLIVKEGIKYEFAHRSFQEYFSAYCLCSVTSKNFSQIVTKFARRPNDQVLPLISDMHPELLREGYIMPLVRKFSGSISLIARLSSVAKFFAGLEGSFDIASQNRKNGRRIEIALSTSGEMDQFVDIIERFAPSDGEFEPAKNHRRQIDLDEASVLQMRKILALPANKSFSIKAKNGHFIAQIEDKNSHVTEFDPNEEFDKAFSQSNMYDFIARRMKRAAVYIEKEKSLSGSSADAMKEIFDI